MEKFKYIFIVLVYRNTKDIIDFIQSSKKVSNSKVIIVNSYYDEASDICFKEIANKFICGFLSIPNKGYGYGNNRGIEYANQHYTYDYLIVSNPDIDIKKFDDLDLTTYENGLYGAMIKTKTNKNQNPYWLIENRYSEYLIYKGYKKNIRTLIYVGIIINKIIREIALVMFNISKQKLKKVYALHGSFLIFPAKVLKRIGLPYDEEMFLFSEEAYLANLLKRNGILSYIVKNICVLHKEDGSMTISNVNEYNENRKSVVYYYEKYINKSLS